jgi:hypothetical protein
MDNAGTGAVMKRQSKSRMLDDIRARQRNTVWPDTLRNGRTVDAFLWKGSPHATIIQRVGIVVFASWSVIAGLFFSSLAHDVYSEGDSEASFILALPALFFLVIGCRLLRNAFRH